MAMSQSHPFHVRRSYPRALAIAGALLALAAPAAAQNAPRMMMAALPGSFERASSVVERLRARDLMVPVEGVSASQLRDTYNHARSGGRVHDAIDIHAPRGTPVLATADGVILKLHYGARGGYSLYHLDDDGRTRYYYAHLDRYAVGINQGVRVAKGQVIGYVGDTGNAQPGDYHLHFAIAILHSVSRWWGGDNVNPYDVFHGGR
jgi:murein DD-endopeptidase MepM/ murein hydrolase activator NlpD